jgi:HPt (histidine-containing phosphotransfer) domain-containing protein
MHLPSERHPAGPAAHVPAEQELPLIDERAMSDWCDDLDKADVLALLARVPGEARACLAGLDKAVAEGDLASARRAAHRLKGMASNLGAARLAHISRGIELRSQTIADVSSSLAALERTVNETLEAIRARA